MKMVGRTECHSGCQRPLSRIEENKHTPHMPMTSPSAFSGWRSREKCFPPPRFGFVNFPPRPREDIFSYMWSGRVDLKEGLKNVWIGSLARETCARGLVGVWSCGVVVLESWWGTRALCSVCGAVSSGGLACVWLVFFNVQE